MDVVVTNNGKPDVPVTLTEKFTYMDVTPPTVTGTDPADGTVFSEYENSLNVRDSLMVTFSEPIDADSVSIEVAVTKTEDSMSEPAAATLSGTVSGSDDSVTFTSDIDMPMRAGRMYAVTVSGAADMAGNTLATSHSFSFSVTSPEPVDRYVVQEEDIQEANGETALRHIAARPEIYDNAELWTRLVAGNQDDYVFDRTKLSVGQRLWVKRGRAWGDK